METFKKIFYNLEPFRDVLGETVDSSISQANKYVELYFQKYSLTLTTPTQANISRLNTYSNKIKHYLNRVKFRIPNTPELEIKYTTAIANIQRILETYTTEVTNRVNLTHFPEQSHLK